MTVSGIGGSTGAAPVGREPKPPSEVTKRGLADLRDRVEAKGGDTTDLDTLIQKFDEAAGSGGKMTFEQFKSFAKENGVTLPEPKSGRPSGPPPGGASRGAMVGAAPSGSRASSASSTSSASSSSDVTTASDSELQTRAMNGEMAAIRELERRQKAKHPDDPVGQNVDRYA